MAQHVARDPRTCVNFELRKGEKPGKNWRRRMESTRLGQEFELSEVRLDLQPPVDLLAEVPRIPRPALGPWSTNSVDNKNRSVVGEQTPDLRSRLKRRGLLRKGGEVVEGDSIETTTKIRSSLPSLPAVSSLTIPVLLLSNPHRGDWEAQWPRGGGGEGGCGTWAGVGQRGGLHPLCG